LRKLSWLGHVPAELEIFEDQLGLSSASSFRHAGSTQMSASGRLSIRVLDQLGTRSNPTQTSSESSVKAPGSSSSTVMVPGFHCENMPQPQAQVAHDIDHALGKWFIQI